MYAYGTEQILLHYTNVSDFRTIRNYTTSGCRMMRRASAPKTGVVLGKFISQCMAQQNLFDEDGLRLNSEALMLLINELNQQGWTILYFAGQGIQQ